MSEWVHQGYLSREKLVGLYNTVTSLLSWLLVSSSSGTPNLLGTIETRSFVGVTSRTTNPRTYELKTKVPENGPRVENCVM